MSPRAPRIAIFGGSFNPIHVGHLMLAEEAADRLKLDRVIFVPAAASPFKGGGGMAPAQVRLEMARRATAGNPRFAVSDVEVRRGGRSYTVDTLEHFSRSLPRRARLWLLLGRDAAADLGSWREPRRILHLARLAVASRDGSAAAALRRLRPLLPRGARPVEIPLHVDVSATDIRRKLSKGRSVRYLVPDAALRLIVRRGLYRRDR